MNVVERFHCAEIGTHNWRGGINPNLIAYYLSYNKEESRVDYPTNDELFERFNVTFCQLHHRFVRNIIRRGSALHRLIFIIEEERSDSIWLSSVLDSIVEAARIIYRNYPWSWLEESLSNRSLNLHICMESASIYRPRDRQSNVCIGSQFFAALGAAESAWLSLIIGERKSGTDKRRRKEKKYTAFESVWQKDRWKTVDVRGIKLYSSRRERE